MNTLPFDRFGVMLDCSRNAVRSLPTLKKMVDLLQAMGYNTLMLYMEDTFEVMHQPYFGYLRGRYSIAELQEIDRYARERGMEVVPCIQTLAHINAITRWDCYYQMIDCEDILLIDDERTYRLIDDMMASLAEAFSGRLINVGMDEAYLFGLGKYREEHGDPDRFALFSRHVQRVAEIARKYGFSPMMWSDMYYRCIQGTYIGHTAIPEHVREAVPENMSLVYWDYYSSDRERYHRMIASHREFGRPLWFAGGAWTWNGEVPDNRFAMRSLEAGLTECIQAGIRQAFVTLWGDNGGECSCFAALPALWHAAELARGNTDSAESARRFEEIVGMSYEDFLEMDLPEAPGKREDGPRNPEKYMLYNDCFSGIYDSTAVPEQAPAYGREAARLEPLRKHGTWGYLFESHYRLCRVMELKYSLGLRTRAVYAAGDREAMRGLTAEYRELSARLRAYYEAFRRQWMEENKPYGFDVQDIRLGGLMCRVQHCTECLQAWADGDAESIAELEEPLLDAQENPAGFTQKPLLHNNWSRTATACVL